MILACLHLLTTGYSQVIQAPMALFATPKALDRLSDRLREIEDDCADLKRANRKLDLEFTELYDKVSHQMGRMAKRYATRETADTPEAEPNSGDLFIARVDPISAKILARRNRAGTAE